MRFISNTQTKDYADIILLMEWVGAW